MVLLEVTMNSNLQFAGCSGSAGGNPGCGAPHPVSGGHFSPPEIYRMSDSGGESFVFDVHSAN